MLEFNLIHELFLKHVRYLKLFDKHVFAEMYFLDRKRIRNEL